MNNEYTIYIKRSRGINTTYLSKYYLIIKKNYYLITSLNILNMCHKLNYNFQVINT